MTERLQKLIAAAGVTSRRKAEELIRAGRVSVNGQVAALGDSADPDQDEITVDGAVLAQRPATVTLLLNKPRGYVTTVSDERGRRTVMELVPNDVRLFPVGRLDFNSEGLLLLTNDGALANRLMHPKQEVPKSYLLWVNRFYDGAEERLQRPIVLDGKPIRRPEVVVLKRSGTSATLRVTIHEGRNRQIRRMCEQASLQVTRLKRISEGKLELGTLPPGGYRSLTEEEKRYLASL